MAEGKKSIIVYADWIKKFEALEDDEAGRLIKHFFRYVNDLNPIAPDRITSLSFIDIEQSLKRDLVKWGDFRKKQSENGKLGGRPQKPIPKEDNPENPSLLSESQKSLSVNVSVTDNAIKEKEVFLLTFNQFREEFPGTKRGSETEFDYLCKCHKDWKLVIPTLPEVIKKQKEDRAKKESKGEFVPEWKNLKTWLYNRCW